MRTTLIGILLVSFLFLVKPAYSDVDSESRVHVIITWDMSRSMRTDGPVDWTRAGADFFNEYFSNYHHRCQVLTVDLISWGLQSLPPVRVELRSADKSKLLADYASKLTRFKHDGTSPKVGMLFANSYVTPDYDKTIIIFISDAGLNSEGNGELWNLVAPTTEFYGISLSDNLSRNYVRRHIVPKHGRHYHTVNEAHFRDVLTMILDDLGQDHCPTN
jgi:hypothetical protein